MTRYRRPVDIGTLHLEGNIFAAPMAGYTDRVTRSLALRSGADLAYTEMISAEALVRGSRRTLDMIRPGSGEDILAVQLFGSRPEILEKAALIAAAGGAALLDLNAGCPVSKIVSKGAGAALGRNPRILAESVSAMKAAGLPVTVKLRLGWDDDEITWKDAALAAVEAGASAIGFHPRTRKQGYGGSADWSAISEMVRFVPVPVIGSGDLTDPEAVLKMLRETGCRGVMVARGAVGNPFIFRQIQNLLSGTAPSAPVTREDRLLAALTHLKKAAREFGEEISAGEMKKHLAGYVKGWPGAAELRQKLMMAGDYTELISILSQALSQAPSPSSR